MAQAQPSALLANAAAQAGAAASGLPRDRGLREAFDQFNQMAGQLAESYQVLEDRVATLTRELESQTAQRLAELAAKEQLADRLENLLHILPAGVLLLDDYGYVVEANPAARELLGTPLQGELWRELIQQRFAPRADDGHEVSTVTGKRVAIATRSLDDGGGQLLLLMDQTETRRLQEQVSRNQRLTALGEMMAALAHQIRTPLSTAMLYAGHLTQAELPSGQRQRFAEKLQQRLNHLECQVRDMLLFVKGELPRPDWITVSELVSAWDEAMAVPVQEHQGQVAVANHCPDRVLHCNREALVSALMNLVTNALQAGGNGTRLHLTMADRDDALVIRVEDDGPGIDPALLPTVSDLFVTTKSQGTGLGLAVVQAVARAHGGDFTLTSEPGQGTCAQLRLPWPQDTRGD